MPGATTTTTTHPQLLTMKEWSDNKVPSVKMSQDDPLHPSSKKNYQVDSDNNNMGESNMIKEKDINIQQPITFRRVSHCSTVGLVYLEIAWLLTLICISFRTQRACVPVIPMVVSVPHVLSWTPGESLRPHHTAWDSILSGLGYNMIWRLVHKEYSFYNFKEKISNICEK